MWIRRRADRRERLLSAAVAGAAGVAVGAVTLYLARLLVARERVHRHPPGARIATEERTGSEEP